MEIIYYVFVAVLLALLGGAWWFINEQAKTMKEMMAVMKQFGDLGDQNVDTTNKLIGLCELMTGRKVNPRP